MGRAPRTKETLPDFLKWRRVTRHPLVFRGLTGDQRTPGFWGVTLGSAPAATVEGPTVVEGSAAVEGPAAVMSATEEPAAGREGPAVGREGPTVGGEGPWCTHGLKE